MVTAKEVWIGVDHAMSMTSAQLPLPIASYLTSFSRQRRAQRVVWRFGLATLFTLIWAMAWCVIDRLSGLSSWTRAAALLINAIVIVAIVARPLVRIFGRTNFIAAANETERREPAFAERLQTVVSQFSHSSRRDGASPGLLAALADSVAVQMARNKPAELLPWTPALRPWIACGIALTGWMVLSFVSVLDMPRLISRYAFPLSEIAPAATTRLFVSPGDARIPEGQTLRVRASVQRLGNASSPVLHVRPDGQDWTEQPLIADSTAAGSYEARVFNLDRDVEYYVTGGDARSDRFVARVLRRPAVVTFHVRYAYPPYTALPPKEVSDATGVFEAPVGTEATVAIESSEPLSAARLIVGGTPMETTATSRPNVREAKLTISEDRRFNVRLTSASGVVGAFRGGRIRALRDRPPIVVLQNDSSDASAPAGARVTVSYAASDDFGLGRLDAELHVLTGTSVPDRVTPISIVGDAREQRGNIAIDLASLRLADGDRVEITLRAEDRAGQFAQSAPLRLVIANVAAGPSPTAASARPESSTRPQPDEPPPLVPAGYEDAIRAYFEAISRRR